MDHVCVPCRHADVTKKLQQTELQLDDKAGAIFPRDNLVVSDATFHRMLSELKQLAAGVLLFFLGFVAECSHSAFSHESCMLQAHSQSQAEFYSWIHFISFCKHACPSPFMS